ncbi:hypothetical protein [Cellulosilyticum sp. WCF-2]|uniref:hypothetical protein n=1 Tax=Cellulosilyticum sp. WCF-2 TaxID=2497860 RepID=UPI000F8F4A71|nr:hypothetical protein [Cellulosilyticum sp. WCF-2]QEH68626.1 hypothetical protein EKH84_09675 [Cellulosilyticum sp. WCF-2]
MSKRKMAVVVDACILHSAGKTEVPVSKACREVLDEIRKQKCCVALNKELIAEWKKHKSSFSHTWWAAMCSQGLIYKVDKYDENLRKCIARECDEYKRISDKEKEDILKDIHLAELAFETSDTIFSRDEKVKKLFFKVKNQISELADIIWINPVDDPEAVEFFKEKDDMKLRNKRIIVLCI